MGFRRDKPIALKGSASAMANNLSVEVDVGNHVIHYAVIHKAVVNLITASTDGSMVNHRQIICKDPSASSHGNTVVLQARIVSLLSRNILVMTSQKGIQMFDADASIMLFWHSLADDGHGEESPFGRGICGIGENMICVGTSKGHILVFAVPSRGTNISLVQTLRGHNSAVCAIESSHGHLVSSNDTGNIIVWECGDDDFDMVNKVAGLGYPGTSLALTSDFIVCGFGSGHLRVYNMHSAALVSEATAHAKWVTAVDSSERNGLVLSAGEDAFVRVWRVSKAGELEHVHSENVPDLQLQGAKFIGRDGRAFGCTGYDCSEIIFYTQA